MNHERNILMNIGRVVEIDQRVDRRSYIREYQKIWRKRHPHYYRDLLRKKKEIEDMSKLQEIQNVWNEIQVNCLEVKYKTSAFNEDKMKTLVEDFNKLMNDYIEELKKDSEVEDANE